MKLEKFTSGTYAKQYGYRSFSPSKINVEWIWEDSKLNTLLAEANRKLGSFDAYSTYIPDVDIFIEMHVAKEAAKSSKIEGTQTGIDEVVKEKVQVYPERRDDWQEVHNYIEAMNVSINELVNLPISTRLLKRAHKILLSGVRGENRDPGEFRVSQNWIGGATIRDAHYIPPVHSEIGELMNDLEKFLHNNEIDVPVLIRIAFAHYQFETIHPFLDGNGRIGRLLITLYLVSQGSLTKPSLYLSDFFERYRQIYYENLSAVRSKNEIIRWLKFFLTGIIETSEKGVNTFKSILDLKEHIEDEKLPQLGKKLPTAKKFMKYLYRKPIVTSQSVKRELNVSLPTTNSLIDDFVKLKILNEITGFKRNRQFEFSEYLNLFKD